VIETRRGHVVNTLRWLLSDMDLQMTQPIPIVVPLDVSAARHAARALPRHTQPWEDPNRLMAGKPWETDRECTGHEEPEFTEPDPHAGADSPRHRAEED
jgi:hypothetical protein